MLAQSSGLLSCPIYSSAKEPHGQLPKLMLQPRPRNWESKNGQWQPRAPQHEQQVPVERMLLDSINLDGQHSAAADEADIVARSTNAEEQKAHLWQLLQLLREHRLYAKLPKCTFNRPEVPYLGHVVGKYGLKVDPAKVATACNGSGVASP